MYKTVFLTGGFYDKLPINNQAFLEIENSDMLCALWSLFVFSNTIEPRQNKQYTHHFDRLHTKDIDFTDVSRFVEYPNLVCKKFFIVFFSILSPKWDKRRLLPVYLSE